MKPPFTKREQVSFPSTEEIRAIVSQVVTDGRRARLKFRGEVANKQQVLLNAILAYIGSLSTEERLAILAVGLERLDAMLAADAPPADLSNPEFRPHKPPKGKNRRGA